MNKSLKFLAIGLALAVLLVSQVGVDRSAVAHVGDDIELVSLDQDEVMFVDHHGQEKMFYKFDDTVHFLLRDNDLAQDTSRFTETVTWTLPAMVPARGVFNLVTGAVNTDGPINAATVSADGSTPIDTPNVATTSAGIVTATLANTVGTVTFKGTDFPPADNPDTLDMDESAAPFGENAFAGGFELRLVDQDLDESPADPDTNASTTDDYYLLERGTDPATAQNVNAPVALDNPAALTPLVESPVVKIGYRTVIENDTGTAPDVTPSDRITIQTEVFVVAHSAEGGTFTLLDPVAAFTDCPDAPAGGTITCTRVVQATFNYHIVDVFKDNQDLGTGADDDENRALVTTSSSPSGKWVTISEVRLADLDSANAVGTEEGGMVMTDPQPQSNYYHGSIKLVDDSGTGPGGGRTRGNIYARDGDTITVQFFGKDHTTVIGSAEATADGLDPSIGGVEPVANSVLNEAAPVVRFTVSDAGSGFDTGDFDSHVDLYLVANVNFDDAAEVTATRDATSGCKIVDSQLSATSLNEDEMTVQFRSRRDWGDDEAIRCDPPAGDTTRVSQFLAQTSALRENSHGDPFGIRIVATDVAGNEQRSLTKLTIDGQAPLLVAAGSYTGRTWNVDTNKEGNAANGIRLKFNESLDVDTVDADDFTVENPDVTVEDVIVGGVNTEDGDQDLNEIVYLVLSEDLDSSDEPRVELNGSIMDLAGNERTRQTITRITDRIGPAITVDTFLAQLLAKDGETTVSFGADENLSSAGSSADLDICTCLSISGGGQMTAGAATTKGGTVTLPTPSTATYVFKQSAFKSTGIYGIMVQGTDSGANETKEGATKVSNEEVTLTAADVKADGMVVVSLSNWPLADADFDGSLADEVSVSTSSGGDAVATSVVSSVDWKGGTVTMDLGGTVTKGTDDALNRTKIYVTYSYVKAEQTVQVDDLAPTATFRPSGDTQNARPFIEIQWNENEYAGDTHKTVTITSATLTGPDDFEMVLVDDETDMLRSSDDILYTYLPDSDLALGEYTITAVGRDAAGNTSDPLTGTFKVVARPLVTIPLNLGWNLVSLPGAAADSAIDAVINVDEVTQVLTYDPTVEGGWIAAVRVNGSWEGGLTNIDPSKAYLIYTTSVDDLKVDIPGFAQGTQEFPPTIQVYTGWNMIPASSLNPGFEVALDTYLASIKWTRGYYYGSDGAIVQVTKGENDVMVKTGTGFLIYVEEDGTLVP